jgi:TolB-like protein/lipopolysaccharide biosynthesis regulator YciM
MDLKKFFSELKRRNVYKVAITYAIVAWLILQIGSVVFETIKTPDWVMQVLLFFVAIGFPIALVLAWAFEMSPQGMIRTSSSSAKENHYSTGKKKPLSHIVYIGILLLIIIGQFIYIKYWDQVSINTANMEKTIAVLPFRNDSPNEENLYFCNGIMEGILDHLSKIPELTVISRTSVEQYRDNPPSSKEIAEQLGVKYLVEGSVQRIDNQVVIFAQLIYAEDDKHLWSQKYNRDVTELFKVQANVTESIANKLQAIITPTVKERIEAIPTKDLMAYENYLKGNEFRYKAISRDHKNNERINLLDKARLNYELAIEKDSLFAQAYIGLALVEFNRNEYSDIAQENYLDNVFAFANNAIKINPNLSEAYRVLALYYWRTNQVKLAEESYKKALELNPNNIEALYIQHELTRDELDFINAIKILQKIEKRVSSIDELWKLYNEYSRFYDLIGDLEMSEYYLKKCITLKPNTVVYFWWLYQCTNRFDEAISYILKYVPVNNQHKNVTLAGSYYFKGDIDKALEFYEKWNDLIMNENFNLGVSTRDSHRYGQVLILSGQKEKGLEMMQRQIELNEKLFELERADLGHIYDLAGIYSFLGQKEKAFYWMERFEKENGWLSHGSLTLFVKNDPQFDAIRHEKQFKDWVSRGEKKLEGIRKEIREYLASEETNPKAIEHNTQL